LKDLSFSRDKRLVSNRQFKAILAYNLRAGDNLLTLYMARNDCGHPRLGVSVGKSCGKAAVRNRLKRLLREAFRQSQDTIPAGFDYLLMISPELSGRLRKAKNGQGPADRVTFEQVKSSFVTLVKDAARLGRFARRTSRAQSSRRDPPGA